MNRIKQAFKSHSAYVGYLTAGDGGYQHSLKSVLALITGGVNIIEIGVPFSDPVADGPTIQQASQRALEQGMTLSKTLELVADIRQQSEVPIILFSYYNPIYNMGEAFYQRAKKAGTDGILMVDLPLEESQKHLAFCQHHQLDPIFLISPKTTEQRLDLISKHAKGMLYYVCRNGTTGVKSSLPDDFASNIAKIRKHSRLPIITGFGISTQAMAKQALEHADGFVVGSLFVDTVAQTKDYAVITQKARSIKP